MQDKAEEESDDGKAESAGEIVLMELAVLPGSVLGGRSASDVLLRTRYGINMLALSRQGHRLRVRLRLLPIKAGDLLLMQGPPAAISAFAADTCCVPLAERELRIPNKRKAWLSVGIMTFSVGLAAFGLLPAAISFSMGGWPQWRCAPCRRAACTTPSTGRWWCCWPR